MTCFRPIDGVRGLDGVVRFNPKEGYVDMHVQVACGRCRGCRADKARDWAIRCVHEAQLHEHNTFVTLTYNDENLPQDLSVDKKHFQKFMRDLRYAKSTRFKNPATGRWNRTRPLIRYLHCGEYGTKNLRPHYHAILFNTHFPDAEHWKTSKSGEPLKTSRELDEVWGRGYASLGGVTFQSAAYVARYITKKITGDKAETEYERINYNTGETWTVDPPYATMSRKPGLGSDWIEKWTSDVYPHDFVIIEGHKNRPPRFYDQRLKMKDPNQFERIETQRREGGRKYSKDRTWQRLRDREKVADSKAEIFGSRDID